MTALNIDPEFTVAMRRYSEFSKIVNETYIDVSMDSPFYSSIDGVLFDKKQTTLIKYPAKKHGAYAIPDSVTEIGGWAFKGCISLTEIAIPNSVTEIGRGAFDGCTGLTKIYSLNPKPPKTGTHKWETIHDHANRTMNNVFKGVPDTCCLYVPTVAIDAYKSASGWGKFSCIKLLTDKSQTYNPLVRICNPYRCSQKVAFRWNAIFLGIFFYRAMHLYEMRQ